MSRLICIRGACTQHRCPSTARCISNQQRTHRRDRTGGAPKLKNGMIELYFRTPIGRLAPIGEIAPGCDKKHNVGTFKYRSHPGANLRMITVIKSVVTGQAPVTLELRNTPGKNTNNPGWYTHISQLTQFMPPPETYKSEIGGQPTMCQVHTGAYVSLLAPGKTYCTACHPRKTTTYILHVVPINTHKHDRRKVNWKKRNKEKKRR